MIEIEKLRVGDYSVNCYIVHEAGRKDCVLVDPGYEPERNLQHLAEENLTPVAILLTHAHFDHIGGVCPIVAATGVPVYLGPNATNLPDWLMRGYALPGEDEEKRKNRKLLPEELHVLREGDKISLAGIEFSVLETPGHAVGSLCCLCGDNMLSGDTLFCGTYGRTDLPGGSPIDMARSLAKLKALPGDYNVYPGHGEITTLARERDTNPGMA